MQVISAVNIGKFMRVFFHKFSEDKPTDQAAMLAYYFFLSLFPLLLFLLTLLPYFPLDVEAIVSSIKKTAPGDAGSMIADQVQSLLSQSQGALLSIGIIGTLWSASGAVSALIRSFNKAYHVKETRSFIQTKALAIGLTVGMILVIIVTFVFPIFGELIIKGIESIFPVPTFFMKIYTMIRWLAGIIMMILVMTLLYRIAPNKSLRFKEVIWGALFTTVAWQLITLGFSFYVKNFGNYSATYGALGGVIIMLLWFFLTGLILVVGGQVNATLSELRHSD